MVGPGVVISVAYVDPGNFMTNIEGGARYGYLLLWVILGASLIAMPVQYLSAKLGIVTGHGLPELCRGKSAIVRCGMWLQAETVVIATDIAEFVGAAIGLNLLFNIPLPAAGVITGALAFGILAMQRHGYRPFETAIATMLAVIAGGFIYETLRIGPSAHASVSALLPHFDGPQSLFLAVGIVGATVMPHAVYLHSGLTRDRAESLNSANRNQLLRLQGFEVAAALGAAGLVNMAMLAVAARLFSGTTFAGLNSLQEAHTGFSHLAGGVAALVFATALFVSGVSSSTVGTYAGQFVMQGFIDRAISPWIRRAITMAPALAVLTVGVNPSNALLLSQVVLSFGLPFALCPLIALTSRRSTMGDQRNTIPMTALACSITVLIIVLDATLLFHQIW